MRRRELLATVPIAATVAGCTIGDPPEDDEFGFSVAPFDGGEIPERYTCDGDGVSPPLLVENIPSAVESLAFVGEWLRSTSHGTIWLLWGIPATDRVEIPADLPDEPTLNDPAGARQGTNDEGDIGYRTPCHETPDHQEYRITVLALEVEPELEPGADRDEFDDVVDPNVVASESVIAAYERF